MRAPPFGIPGNGNHATIQKKGNHGTMGTFFLITTLEIRIFTPWKINMEPTNHPFRKENDLPNLQGIMFHVSLHGCIEITRISWCMVQKWKMTSPASPSVSIWVLKGMDYQLLVSGFLAIGLCHYSLWTIWQLWIRPWNIWNGNSFLNQTELLLLFSFFVAQILS